MARKLCERFRRFLTRITTDPEKSCQTDDVFSDADAKRASSATTIVDVLAAVRKISETKIRNCPALIDRRSRILKMLHDRTKVITDAATSSLERKAQIDSLSSLKKSGSTPGNYTEKYTPRRRSSRNPMRKRNRQFTDQFSDLRSFLF